MRKTRVASAVITVLGLNKFSSGTRFTTNHIEYISYPPEDERNLMELDAWLVDASTPNFKIDDPLRDLERSDYAFIPYSGLKTPSDGEIYQRVGRGFDDNGLTNKLCESMDALLMMETCGLVPTTVHLGTAVKREVGNMMTMPSYNISPFNHLFKPDELADLQRASDDMVDRIRQSMFCPTLGNDRQTVTSKCRQAGLRNKYRLDHVIEAELGKDKVLYDPHIASLTPTPEMVKAMEDSQRNGDKVAFSVRSVGSRIPDELLDSRFKLPLEDRKRASDGEAPWIVELPLTTEPFNVKDIPDVDIVKAYPQHIVGEKDED